MPASPPPAPRVHVRRALADHPAPTPQPTPCRLWQGPTIRKGYGIRPNGHLMHRWVWRQVHGPIPIGMQICHHCDQPLCYRLEHLFLGTPADNTADMVAKGRSRKGTGIEGQDQVCDFCGKTYRFVRITGCCSKRCAGRLRAAAQPEPEHGTRASYRRGCRCDRCREWNAEVTRQRRRRLRMLAAITVLVGTVSACSPQQVGKWIQWWERDPQSAVEFARQPWVQESLRRNHLTPNNTPFDDRGDVTLDGEWRAGDCDSFRDEIAAAGLPVNTFINIARRETGCDPWAWVVDSNDVGGALMGLNLKGNLAEYLYDLCGATVNNIRGNLPLILKCTKRLYDTRGLDPWQ